MKFWKRVGWRVHGFTYPFVWWARRKPRSTLRQWVWDRTDRIQMRRAMRYYRKLQRMSRAELEAHVRKTMKP